jgi:drug/metabolite transporter (DMT)-like permease
MHIPWTIFAVSVILMLVSVPLIFKRVPKNNFYGLRTTRTLNGTDAEWLAANYKAGIALCFAGLLAMIACILVPLLDLPVKTTGLVCSAVLLVVVLGAAYFSMRPSSAPR